MTKTFEEELKDREAETFSHWDGCTISKKEFINYADVVNLSQGWVSPEEYEKLVKNCAVYVLECKNINRVNAQLTKENEDLKSQLQQQALPVVPECVAEWIECVKGKNNNALALLDDDNMPDDVNEWLFFQRNDDNINLILRAWLDGYTVEKPQLFYLKNKITGNVLVYDESPELSEVSELFATGGEFELENYTFTQSEIDSMQTGSYEQIEVEK